MIAPLKHPIKEVSFCYIIKHKWHHICNSNKVYTFQLRTLVKSFGVISIWFTQICLARVLKIKLGFFIHYLQSSSYSFKFLYANSLGD